MWTHSEAHMEEDKLLNKVVIFCLDTLLAIISRTSYPDSAPVSIASGTSLLDRSLQEE